MAFWGVEVRPGKPFTHKHDDSKGRLHISMATLGLGTSKLKSTLQCNVGNLSPVYLCSLYPGNTESLQLNLELEEADQAVVFSVIGPRSIHLCGYYLAASHNANAIDDSESYGEDIADTETEKSDYSDEDEYDDSFIDDDDDDGAPEVFPASPISGEEEVSHDDRRKGRKGSLRRLRKKYQSVESDDDCCNEEKIIVNDSMDDQTPGIKDEDSLPISSLFKNKVSGRVLDQEMDANVDRREGDASNKNGEDGGNSIGETNLKADHVLVDSQMQREAQPSNHLVEPCTALDVGDIKNLKKKRKRKEKETNSSCNDHSIKLDNGIGGRKYTTENVTQDFVAGNIQQQHADDKDVNISGNGALPAAETDTDPKRNRTKKKKKEQVNKSDNGYHEGIFQEDKANRDAAESKNLIHKVFEGKEQHQKLTNEMSVDDGAHDFPDGDQSEDKKVKKRKKMSKSRGNGEVVNSDMPVSIEQSGETEMMGEDRNKREESKPSQVRTLANGLVIEELEKGREEGKVAASGKKISIYYTGKTKENGVVFDSNAGQAPFKFRLGKGKVIQGWDVGLEGMQVGEKRRLVIPPTLTSENDGHSAKIPPNSWLVYDIELVKVH